MKEIDSQEPGFEKKKYEKPAIVYTEKIEARAAVCSGSGAKINTGTCTGPITS